MDTKNLIAAISLSAAVIIIYALFFGPSPEEIKRRGVVNVTQTVLYDPHGDPVINVFDLFTLIDFTIQGSLNECSENVMNINSDNHINILDVIELMKNLLNSD